MGRADAVTTTAAPGTYIVPADVVSGLGDGNTLAGARRLDDMVGQAGAGYERGGPVGPGTYGGGVPVHLSGGEYGIPPHVVAGLGGGSVDRGADRLDRLVAMVRASSAQRMRNALPPK
jgi:hypothetical protein